jgi:hypothetical protein
MPNAKITMKTIVVKGSNYSFNDMQKMKATKKSKVLRVVFIHPSGTTTIIDTDVDTFKSVDEGVNNIIYGESDVYGPSTWDDDDFGIDISNKNL